MGEIIVSILFLLLSIFMFINSNGFTSNFSRGSVGAAGFPKLIAVLIFVISVVYIIRYLKNKKIVNLKFEIKTIYKEYKLVIITLALFLVYIISMKYVGFILSTIFYLVSSQWLLSDRNKKNIPVIIVMTLLISLGSYYFFTSYLSVTFPMGKFFE